MPRATRGVSRRDLLFGGGIATTLAIRSRSADARAARPARKFDVDRFVADCRTAALAQPANSQAAIRELLASALGDRNAVLEGLGAPAKGGLKMLYRSDALTILNIVWSPLMQLLPHEHRMWAVIGLYTGREDNVFWKRSGESLTATTATALSAGAVVPLASDVIHSVNNPIEKLTGAIHIYGGDFFAVHRSEWDPDTLIERDWNIRAAVRNFEESNARFAAAGACAGGASR